jgi:hypothetical protein
VFLRRGAPRLRPVRVRDAAADRDTAHGAGERHRRGVHVVIDGDPQAMNSAAHLVRGVRRRLPVVAADEPRLRPAARSRRARRGSGCHDRARPRRPPQRRELPRTTGAVRPGRAYMASRVWTKSVRQTVRSAEQAYRRCRRIVTTLSLGDSPWRPRPLRTWAEELRDGVRRRPGCATSGDTDCGMTLLPECAWKLGDPGDCCLKQSLQHQFTSAMLVSASAWRHCEVRGCTGNIVASIVATWRCCPS